MPGQGYCSPRAMLCIALMSLFLGWALKPAVAARTAFLGDLESTDVASGRRMLMASEQTPDDTYYYKDYDVLGVLGELEYEYPDGTYGFGYYGYYGHYSFAYGTRDGEPFARSELDFTSDLIGVVFEEPQQHPHGGHDQGAMPHRRSAMEMGHGPAAVGENDGMFPLEQDEDLSILDDLGFVFRPGGHGYGYYGYHAPFGGRGYGGTRDDYDYEDLNKWFNSLLEAHESEQKPC